MNVKHFSLLSWFKRRGEGHEQDGEMLSATSRMACAKRLRPTAACDPAMAFIASAKANRRNERPVQNSAAMAAGDDADIRPHPFLSMI